MNKLVKLKLKKNINDSYDIIISAGLNLGKEIKKIGLINNYAIITDSNVYRIYKDIIEKSFSEANINFKFIVIKAGERSKSLKNLENISSEMIKLGFDRKSSIVALGGGVVGDLAGYVAGTFMRGISFIQIPTTLLASVDSSIGGKVAVDLSNGKNSSGLFYQPKKVLIDVDFLMTLPEAEFNSGMMEIVKHGIIRNEKYFKFIESNFEKIKKRDKETLIELIHGSCLIKTAVVEKDEKESGLRMILNFGHTIGHALEINSKYKLKHGFAVGAGMIKESEIASKIGLLGEKDFSRIKKLIEAFSVKEVKYNKPKLLTALKKDKKNSKNDDLEISIPVILPLKIGNVVIKKFNLEELTDFI